MYLVTGVMFDESYNRREIQCFPIRKLVFLDLLELKIFNGGGIPGGYKDDGGFKGEK